MHLFWWIIVGLIAGWAVGKIMRGSGYGPLMDIVLGIVGAVLGGWIFGLLGASGVTGLNIYSLIVAVIGAIIALSIYHAIHRVV